MTLLAAATGVLAAVDARDRGFLAALAFLALVVGTWRWAVARRRDEAAPGWLVIDDEQIARVDPLARRAGTSLARWTEPFGMLVLANMAQSRALLVFTSKVATRFLHLELQTPRDAGLLGDLLARAVTVPDADLEHPLGPTPEVVLGPAAARALFEEVHARCPDALRRMYLSDARDAAISVEDDALVIGDAKVDLALPVEWRVFSFVEGEPGTAVLYQATSIRQGAVEVVLVCRASEELASWSVGRGSDAPPAREARVAIDRLFMTPVRAVLERAPRLSRPGAPPSVDRGRAAQTRD